MRWQKLGYVVTFYAALNLNLILGFTYPKTRGKKLSAVSIKD